MQQKKNEFYCDHEEADTKMFAYFQFLSNIVQLKRVIISSPDTEVPVISLYHYVTNLALLNSIWLKKQGLVTESDLYQDTHWHQIMVYKFVVCFLQ